MAEIVYDIAPSASLYFHDCGNDQIQFNAAITECADAGYQVIVDDIYWLDDPYLEDGAIAQTIDLVVQTRNIVYVTSAGNRAQRHYQGLFADQGLSAPGWHDFRNGGTSESARFYVNIPNGAGVVVYLQWDDRFGYWETTTTSTWPRWTAALSPIRSTRRTATITRSRAWSTRTPAAPRPMRSMSGRTRRPRRQPSRSTRSPTAAPPSTRTTLSPPTESTGTRRPPGRSPSRPPA